MKKIMPELTVTMTGYGKWAIKTKYYNRTIICQTTNSVAVDDFRDDKLKGYLELRNECIRKSKNI